MDAESAGVEAHGPFTCSIQEHHGPRTPAHELRIQTRGYRGKLIGNEGGYMLHTVFVKKLQNTQLGKFSDIQFSA